MAHKTLHIRIDDRIRLISAVLAATTWPELAQHRKGHRPHAHARSTSKWLAPWVEHPAVKGAQLLLDQNAPLEALYTYALKLKWPSMEIQNPPPWTPPYWNEQLGHFYSSSRLQELWNQDEAAWKKASVEADSVLKNAGFYEFLKPFMGDISDQLVYMPNISYPSDMAIGVRIGTDLICVGPPRIAWGDNPPWPFDEDEAHIFSSSLSEYARLLILAYLRQNAEAVQPITKRDLPVDDAFKQAHPTWGDQFTELFVPGVVALYLEQNVNPQEAKAFILMEKKTRGVTILPGVISVLQRYIREYEDGKYSSLVEYLPHFPNHLRVAKSISAI